MYIGEWKPTTENSHKGAYVPPAPDEELIAAHNSALQTGLDARMNASDTLVFTLPHIPVDSPHALSKGHQFVANALSSGAECGPNAEPGFLNGRAEDVKAVFVRKAGSLTVTVAFSDKAVERLLNPEMQQKQTENLTLKDRHLHVVPYLDAA